MALCNSEDFDAPEDSYRIVWITKLRSKTSKHDLSKAISDLEQETGKQERWSLSPQNMDKPIQNIKDFLKREEENKIVKSANPCQLLPSFSPFFDLARCQELFARLCETVH